MESFETHEKHLLCLACSSRSDTAVISVRIGGNLSAFAWQPGQADGN